jgi:hypothetical protein
MYRHKIKINTDMDTSFDMDMEKNMYINIDIDLDTDTDMGIYMNEHGSKILDIACPHIHYGVRAPPPPPVTFSWSYHCGNLLDGVRVLQNNCKFLKA